MLTKSLEMEGCGNFAVASVDQNTCLITGRGIEIHVPHGEWVFVWRRLKTNPLVDDETANAWMCGFLTGLDAADRILKGQVHNFWFED